jgi:hypothetical protein
MVDFQDGARPNAETEALTKLVVGADPILYDHTGKKTAFATWIATRRGRLKKQFAYDRFVRVRADDGTLQVTTEKLPDGQYYIWVTDPADAVRGKP